MERNHDREHGSWDVISLSLFLSFGSRMRSKSQREMRALLQIWNFSIVCELEWSLTCHCTAPTGCGKRLSDFSISYWVFFTNFIHCSRNGHDSWRRSIWCPSSGKSQNFVSQVNCRLIAEAAHFDGHLFTLQLVSGNGRWIYSGQILPNHIFIILYSMWKEMNLVLSSQNIS